MQARLKELSRFSESGKTFFFNQGEAANGTHYLAINALYGKGQQQRVVLFPAQFLSFFRHLKGAVETLEGIKLGESHVPATSVVPMLPYSCPKCPTSSGGWGIDIRPEEYWTITCDKCQTLIFDSRGAR